MEGFRAPLTLTGRWVQLAPLDLSYAPALRDAARDPEVRRYLLNSPGETLEEMRALIALRLEGQRVGTGLPFVTLWRADSRPIGMTGFLHIDHVNHSVEVGGTWLDSALWRTPVNTESKFLLFRYAFEVGRVHRVSLRTDLNNERSQRAIARLGATREATFRDDKLRADGTYRTSVVFGVLASEWPRVKDGLESMLAREWKGSSTSPPPDGRWTTPGGSR
ncbi:MAG TPA: GNAT family protein [Thermoplasmata archaeon]|nr:GNAT family protein [Thermoplasmata archaeon]